MFAIVDFPDSSETAVVPTSWITSEGKAWWPNYKTISRVQNAAKRRELPDTLKYKLFPVNVRKYYGKVTPAALLSNMHTLNIFVCSKMIVFI